MNAAEYARALVAARHEIDEAFEAWRKAIIDDAEADRVMKVAMASALLSASGTIPEKEAHVDLATADVQYAAKLADGLRRSAEKAVDSKIRLLMSLQSQASLEKSEAQLARWGAAEGESA
jgi:hypothetical protein